MGQVCDIRTRLIVTLPPRNLIGQKLERGKFARAKPSDADNQKWRRQEVLRFHSQRKISIGEIENWMKENPKYSTTSVIQTSSWTHIIESIQETLISKRKTRADFIVNKGRNSL